MKILLFGEYSGFFNCLKDGLVVLGHDVFLASDGDAHKDYPSDFRWDGHHHWGKFQRPFEIVNILAHKNMISGYDVVLVIAPSMFSRKVWPNKVIYDYLIENNKLVYLISTGLYRIGFDYWINKPETKYYGYTSAYVNSDVRYRESYWNKDIIEWERDFMKRITGIIPIWYEYAEPYRNFPNLKKAIRTPININMFDYKPNVIKNGKIVFFHGLSRPCKGGKYILAAFDRLREKHKDDAEFIAAGGLPFDEYMKLIDRTNVIVDDANSYSFCMNALFSMLKGKIVMGGAEPEGNEELGYKDVPVVNICADVDQICDAIEDIIAHKTEIEAWGLKSRKFVEKYHNYIDVAKQYVEQFEEDFKNLKK